MVDYFGWLAGGDCWSRGQLPPKKKVPNESGNRTRYGPEGQISGIHMLQPVNLHILKHPEVYNLWHTKRHIKNWLILVLNM